MTKCLKCGSELHDNQKFCQNCGTPTSLRCPQCGIELKERTKFCPSCGTNVITSEHFQGINTSSSKVVSISETLKKFLTLYLIFGLLQSILGICTFFTGSSEDLFYTGLGTMLFGPIILIVFFIEAFLFYCNILAINGDEKIFKIKTYLLICFVFNVVAVPLCFIDFNLSGFLNLISCLTLAIAFYSAKKGKESNLIILGYIGGVLGVLSSLLSLAKL